MMTPATSRLLLVLVLVLALAARAWVEGARW